MLIRNTDLILLFFFPADLLHLSFLFYFIFLGYSLLPPFMLRIFSGYLGCGLHYGRNGSPQNPFSRKGLYPWAACSSVWHFMWNEDGLKTVTFSDLLLFPDFYFYFIFIFLSHQIHRSYRNSVSWICLTPWLAAAHLLFLQIHWLDSLLTHSSSNTVASSTMTVTWKTWNRINSLLCHSWEVNCIKCPPVSSNCLAYGFCCNVKEKLLI